MSQRKNLAKSCHTFTYLLHSKVMYVLNFEFHPFVAVTHNINDSKEPVSRTVSNLVQYCLKHI